MRLASFISLIVSHCQLSYLAYKAFILLASGFLGCAFIFAMFHSIRSHRISSVCHFVEKEPSILDIASSALSIDAL